MDLLIKNCGPIHSPSTERMYHMPRLEGETILVLGGHIVAVGEAADAAMCQALVHGVPELNAEGALVLPGFVDSHTHPVFNELRAAEYEMRNLGRSYLEIQQAGGGILSSRRSLQEAPRDTLKELVRQRLRHFLELGTTTIEGKSGYGLSVEHELLSLRLLKELAGEEPIRIRGTLLAAHSVPPEYRENREEWFRQIEEEILPVVKREALADYIDAFCEPKVITLDETERICRAGMSHGLRVKLHADQIEAYGGGALAARLQALSADHLEQIDEAGIRQMVEAGTVFALLPGASFFLGQTKHAPARNIIEAGGCIALCTDYNPGSSHIQSMPLILTLATSQMKMSAEEAIWAATLGGARAMGLEAETGCIEAGFSADLALWPLRELNELPYYAGDIRPSKVISGGRVLHV